MKITSFLVGILIMGSITNMHATNLSHEKRENSSQSAIDHLIAKVKERSDLPYVTVEKQVEYINLLSDFGLGRFLLERGGLNGYWTDYVIKHPLKGRFTGRNEENQPLNKLENFLLNRAPTVLATQERFEIFKKEIQKRLHSSISLASIPCGLMADLLDLDFTNSSNISLVGIDLDPESIAYAKKAAEKGNLSAYSTFYQRDAWNLAIDEEFDLITSNGLAIYEPDDTKVTKLYQGFCKALKPGGYLVTSFLTPPPAPGVDTEWNLEEVNREDALLQKIIFADILESKWQVFRTEETVKSQLQKAGFIEIEIIYDKAHIFPSVVAKKPF